MRAVIIALRGCLHEEIVAVTMRTGSPWVLVFWMAVCPAWCQQSNTTDEVHKGHHLATMLCAGCHIAALDQPYAPTLGPPAPSLNQKLNARISMPRR